LLLQATHLIRPQKRPGYTASKIEEQTGHFQQNQVKKKKR